MKVTSVHLPLPSLAVCAAASGFFLLATTSPALACPDEPYIGAICTLGTSYCPQNYLPAQGQILQIQGNAALYALLGTNYGGDGRTTFALPDLRGRSPLGAGTLYAGPAPTTYSLGKAVGAQTVTLTSDNLPAHTHQATFTPATAGQLTANLSVQVSGNVPASGSATPSAATPYLAANGVSKMWIAAPQTNLVTVSGLTTSGGGNMTGTVTNATAGGSTPVSVQPPTTALTYCIASKGYFPPRD